MDPTVVAAWIAAGVSVLTLVGTLVAQYLGYRASSRDAEKTAEEQRLQLDRTLTEQRDQLDRTLTEQREQLDRTLNEQRIRTLNERFATATDRIGSDKPPEVRLAGVYAMAGLADDWAENRQTCVDVLCACLRMPYAPDPGQDAPKPQRLAFRASREVRHTVIRVITAHLREHASTSWQELIFDFRGAVFDGGDFYGVQFSRGVSFEGAEFSGGTVDFSAARFSDDGIFFGYARFSGGRVSFDRAQFSGGRVVLSFAEFSGGEVSFDSACFNDGRVSFNDTQFSGGRVSFDRAVFRGSVVDFTGAQFLGGEIDFSRAWDWSVPPNFPWTETPPAGVKLPTSPVKGN
jgi:hypothetical protein